MAKKSKRAVTPYMNKSWRDWVVENINRGVPAESIYNTLREHGFGLGAIRNALGDEYAAPTEGKDVSQRTVDYAAIANCALTKRNIPNLRKLPIKDAQIYQWNDFLTREECDTIITLADSNLYDSTISTEGKEEDYAFRTSKTCHLQGLNHPMVDLLEQKICDALGISTQWAEQNQAQRYEVGQEFKPHTDYFEPGTEEYTKFCNPGGQRTWTFMIYLNDVEEGGHTDFRKLDRKFKPKRGMAVIWNSLTPEGDPNPQTQHHGTKVSKGVKYVVTKWFRDSGQGPMLLE